MNRKTRVLICLLLAALLLPAGGAFASQALETDAAAVLSGTQGLDGWFIGPVTLTAPAGYSISRDGSAGSFAGLINVLPEKNGEQYVSYYLQDANGTVSPTMYAALSFDVQAPAPALYAPGENAAVSENQKLIFSFAEPVKPVAGKYIQVSRGETVYRLEATNGEFTSDKTDGPWYAVYALTDFQESTGTPNSSLVLALSEKYGVSVEDGAFQDRAGRGSTAVVGTFSTASQEGLAAVIYLLGGESGWAVQTKTDPPVAIPCGGGVVPQTSVQIIKPSLEGRTVTVDIQQDAPKDAAAPFAGAKSAAAGAAANLENLTISADTLINAAVARVPLAGTASVTGTAVTGGTLTASVSGTNETVTSRLIYTWKKDGRVLATGAAATSYSPRSLDRGAVIALEVTDTLLSGTLSAASPEIGSSTPAAPPAPTVERLTAVSVSLNPVSGCEYRLNGGQWTDSPLFSGLSSGQTYHFDQRYKAKGDTPASEASQTLTVTTAGALTGTVTVSGNLQVGSLLTAGLTGSNITGTPSFVWKRGGTTLASSATYQPVPGDAGSQLTVEVTSSVEAGTLSFTTASVRKASSAALAPNAPSAISVTANSVTLSAVQGYEYSNGGTQWQDSPAFTGLTSGATYTFFQRIKETADTAASPTSAGARIITVPTLSGTVTVDGSVRYGKTLVAQMINTNNTGTLTFVWKRGGTPVAVGSTYDVIAADIGSEISVEVSSNMQSGVVSKSVGTAGKAEFVGNVPSAPGVKSRTSASITLKATEGCEYSKNGTSWQSGTVFAGLSAGKSYTFYQRYKATESVEASAPSTGYKTSTNASSDAAESDSDTENNTNSGTGNATGSGTSLNNLTLSAGQTNVSKTDLESLIRGNQTQDVTISAGNVTYTFSKGTMKMPSDRSVFDFGAAIDNCIHVDMLKNLCGEAYVAAVHFNFSGDLPGKATIRIFLGTQHAGKTLYYYKLEPASKTLTYLQAANADAAGYVSVIQSACSDYVLLDRQYEAVLAAATPSPAPSPEEAAPTPTMAAVETDTDSKKNGSGGWLIGLVIIVALALIAAGIALFLKNKTRDEDDEEEGEDESGEDFQEFDRIIEEQSRNRRRRKQPDEDRDDERFWEDPGDETDDRRGD